MCILTCYLLQNNLELIVKFEFTYLSNSSINFDAFFSKAIIYSVNRTIPHEGDSFLTRKIKLYSLAFFIKEPLILFTIGENIIIFHIQKFFPIYIISSEFEHECIKLFIQNIQPLYLFSFKIWSNSSGPLYLIAGACLNREFS